MSETTELKTDQKKESSTAPSASTSEYRLLTGTHVMSRRTYRSGVEGQDVLELTEEQAKDMGDRVRKVSEEKKISTGKESDKEPVDLKDSVDLKTAGGKEKDLKVTGK